MSSFSPMIGPCTRAGFVFFVYFQRAGVRHACGGSLIASGVKKPTVRPRLSEPWSNSRIYTWFVRTLRFGRSRRMTSDVRVALRHIDYQELLEGKTSDLERVVGIAERAIEEAARLAKKGGL